VGIGPTKTLAKLANHWAKKISRVLKVELGSDQLNSIMEATSAGDIWGIGRRQAVRLADHGIFTASQLRDMNDKTSKKIFNILGRKTLLELRGIQCLEEESPTVRKSLFNSRSFGRPVTEKEELKEALAYHCSLAGERLRNEGLTAANLSIYLATSFHSDDSFQTGASMDLGCYTDDTLAFIQAAHDALDKCFKSGPKYMKAGILLMDLSDPNQRAADLFESPRNERRRNLMSALDKINSKYGQGKAKIAAQGKPEAAWHMNQTKKSRKFTTNWEELPRVKA
jgi:DNA polymerase V